MVWIRFENIQYFRVLYRKATWPQVSLIYQSDQRARKRKQCLTTRKVTTCTYALTETHVSMEHSKKGVNTPVFITSTQLSK